MLTRSKSKYFLGFIVFILVLIGLFTGFYITSLLIVCGAYILNEIIWSDHIHYNPSTSDCYEYADVLWEEGTLSDNKLSVPEGYTDKNHTTVVELQVQASFAGKIADPYIEIESGNTQLRQYFERGCKGTRYLNISHCSIEQDSTLKLIPKFCKLSSPKCRLLSFKNPNIWDKKILVLSPHPDDAEIAAFGLYKNSDSMIVTITAGESEPNRQYTKLTGSHRKATELKGRLRAWDSIAVPLWAGLKADRAINLGYSDNSLETLHLNQKSSYPAQNMATFRDFNHYELKSNHQGESSWSKLVEDLREVINDFEPDIVVTPHPEIDAHSDHKFSTIALSEALQQSKAKAITFFYYINHLSNTDNWPFGPQGSLVATPPGKHKIDGGLFSLSLCEDTQADKACALEMMHDLRSPQKTKRKIRLWLQKKIINRPIHPLSQDPYLRKAVRNNELFFTKHHIFK